MGEVEAETTMPLPCAKPWGPYSSSKLMLPSPAVQLTVAELSATVAVTLVGASQVTPPLSVEAETEAQPSLYQSLPQTALTWKS